MLYTPKEAAALLRFSTWTLRQKIRSGEIQVNKLGPRTIRISSEAVEAYLRSTSSALVPGLVSPALAQAARPAPLAPVSAPRGASPALAASAPANRPA